MAALTAGCPRKPIADDPEEQGKLRRVAEKLEEGLGDKPMPMLTEPERLADRLARFDDFRSCTVRAFVAKKREAERLRAQGIRSSIRHATIGEAAVEECAVQSAVVNKDPSVCERLAVDFRGPNNDTFSAARCWDTRARVLGLPDECPVVWLADDLPGRNPECVAAARRDQSLCPFAESPPRCRAIITGDPAACHLPGAAPDCALAVTYWSGLFPVSLRPPLVDPAAAPKPPGITIDIRTKDKPTLRLSGPEAACGVSWPTGKAQASWTEDTMKFWGGEVAPGAVQVSWKGGHPAVKLAFLPAGDRSGVRPVQPPGPSAAATLVLVWPDPHAFRRCLPGPRTTGQLRFDAGNAQPGSVVTGAVDATNLECTDGGQVSVHAEFRLVILDLR